jgi:NADPH2:quinone reductase
LTRGEYQLKPPLPFVPGIEVAGTVRSAPSESGLTLGQRVAAATVLGGGFAEEALAPARLCFSLPDGVPFAEAVALTINFQTAHLALRRRGRMQGGESVLVRGAGGGVGTAAVALAKAWGATRVFALVSDSEKGEAALAAGADELIGAETDWVEHVRAQTEGRGVDLLVDPVGGPRPEQCLRCLAPEGRLLVIGFAAGAIPELALNRLLLRQADAVGVNWGAMLESDPDYPRQMAAEIFALAAEGKLTPVIGRRYPLERTAEALRELETRKSLGKLVIEVDGRR